MTAYYNDDATNVEASFHTLAEAEAYAAAYGGEVTASGVVFVIGNGANHAQAKADAKALADAPVTTPASDYGPGDDGGTDAEK